MRRLIPLGCVLGAVILGASEFADTLEFRSGGQVLAVSSAGPRHDYALLVLAGFAIVALLVAIAAGSRPAAAAVAVAGIAALLVFLLVDVPDVGKVGSFNAFVEGKAHPAGGFWLELIGALLLSACGLLLALLPAEKLRAMAPGKRTTATIPRRA